MPRARFRLANNIPGLRTHSNFASHLIDSSLPPSGQEPISKSLLINSSGRMRRREKEREVDQRNESRAGCVMTIAALISFSPYPLRSPTDFASEVGYSKVDWQLNCTYEVCKNQDPLMHRSPFYCSNSIPFFRHCRGHLSNRVLLISDGGILILDFLS